MLKDINFKEQYVYVEFGKGDKERYVGLDPDLVSVLREYKAKRPQSAHRNFFLQENGEPLNRRVISERVGDIAKRLETDLTPHGLRRTLITRLLKEGTATVLVQKIAGHERLTTTEL